MMLEQKKRKKVLCLDFNCLTRDEVIKTYYEIEKALTEVFREHIGRENAISPFQLFFEVFGINPMLIDVYKRGYWYAILKKVIIEMRKRGDMFIINNGYQLFVLKTQEENDKFQQKVSRHISYLQNLKIRADEWVKNEKWRDIK